MVTLIHEGYFTKNILPLLKKSTGDLTKADSLFRLLAANNEVMPVSKYFEADVTLLGFTIPHMGFLMVKKDPNTLCEPQHSTQLPDVIGCNLIWLGCEEFGRVYRFKAFEEFHCPVNVHPVVFAQMCSFYLQGKLQSSQTQSANQTSSGSINVNTSGISSEVKKEDPSLESVLGQVWVGNTHKAICILANSMKELQGKTNKIT